MSEAAQILFLRDKEVDDYQQETLFSPSKKTPKYCFQVL